MQWISVKEALPKPGQRVLLWYQPAQRVDGKGMMCVSYLWLHSDAGNCVTDRDCGYEWHESGISSIRAKEARYWMPIPEPPELEPLPSYGSYERREKINNFDCLKWGEWNEQRISAEDKEIQ